MRRVVKKSQAHPFLGWNHPNSQGVRSSKLTVGKDVEGILANGFHQNTHFFTK